MCLAKLHAGKLSTTLVGLKEDLTNLRPDGVLLFLGFFHHKKALLENLLKHEVSSTLERTTWDWAHLPYKVLALAALQGCDHPTQAVFEDFFLPLFRELGVKLRLGKSDFVGQHPNPRWRSVHVSDLPAGRYHAIAEADVLVQEEDVDWAQPLTADQLARLRQVGRRRHLDARTQKIRY